MRSISLVIGILIAALLAPSALLPGAAAADRSSEPSARVIADRLNVRSGPGTENAVVATAVRGDIVTVLEESDDWLRVRLPDGKRGWISARFVEILSPEEAPRRGERPRVARERDGAEAARGDGGGGGGGGSVLRATLKWGSLLGAAACGALAWNEHTQGNDAYDDYKARVEEGLPEAETEPLRLDAIDHDDKAKIYGIAAGGLFAAFLVQQFLLGGDDDESFAGGGPGGGPDGGTDGGSRLLLDVRPGALRAGLRIPLR